MARLHDSLLHALLCRRTFALEWFLALESLFCGVWVLAPGRAFGSDTVLLHVPEWITGLVLVGHGVAYVGSLLRLSVRRCRHAALASAGLWSLLATTYVLLPPRGLFAVPLTLGLTAASCWVYLRLYLKYV